MSTIATYDGLASDRTSIRAWGFMFRELREFREVVWRLVSSQIAGQFKQSFIGYVWIALPPIVTTIVFAMLRKANIVNVPMAENSMPYALFALLGTTLWSFFAQVTLSATSSIVASRDLVAKVYFPREVLVLTSVGSSLVNIVVRLGVLAISFALFRYAPQWEAIFLPLILLPMLMLALGMGLLLAPLHTVFPDIGRILGFVFQFAMFLAPTVYPTPNLSDVMNQWEFGLYALHTLNPVTHFMHAVTSLVETGTIVWDAGLIGSSIFAMSILFIGWRFFHVCEPFLAERV